MTVLAKQPSEDLISMIKVAGDSLLSFGELWGSIKAKGETEGFSEKELQEMLRPYLKQKMDSKKIWYLFNKEEHNQKSAENYQKRTINRTIDVEKVIEQSPIPEELSPNVPTKTSEQFYKEQARDETNRQQFESNLKSSTEEESTELELKDIKIAQLEDALHKTEQFKPATQLQPKTGLESQMISSFEDMFQAIMKKADGVNSFYYDAYGIDLFKNRELAQLKNSGVKTFKRLYFEV